MEQGSPKHDDIPVKPGKTTFSVDSSNNFTFESNSSDVDKEILAYWSKTKNILVILQLCA